MNERRATTPLDLDPIVIRVDRAVLGAERRGAGIVVGDPLVAFAILLDLERRRRAGASIPEARLEISDGIDESLAAALARHLPWVCVVSDSENSEWTAGEAPDAAPRSTTRSSPQARAPSTSTGATPRTDVESMSPLVTAAELAMLFEAVERHRGAGRDADASSSVDAGMGTVPPARVDLDGAASSERHA